MAIRRLVMVGGILAGLLVGSTAHAVVMERVVAVVGERPIWLSELRQRARPYLIEIQERVPVPAQRVAAETEVYRQLVQRMVDDQLQAQAAVKMQVRVEVQEVDKAIARLAQSQQMTVQQLLGEVNRSGMSVQDYRLEIRRQLLEGKLLDLRVKGQVRVTEEDMLTLYGKLQREERRVLGYSAQWIVVRVPPGATAEQRAEVRRKADSLVVRARAGEDFGALAQQYSDDSATSSLGGSLGERRPGDLDPSVERVAFGLDLGEVSSPFRYADAFVILRIKSRDPSRLGTFAQARDQLAQRVYAEKLERARRKWLDGLKRQVHVDVRL